MEEQKPTCPSEWVGKTTQVLQAGSMKGILERRPGDQMSSCGVEGSLSLEQWEAQWQEFLRTVESPHSGWEIPPLPEKTSPWEDAKSFLASFEQVAEACQWPQEEWVIQLLPALSGEAKRAFNRLDVPDREDYGTVKAAILRGDVLSQEKQREEFRNFCYQEAEGPWGAYSRLRKMCRGWLRVEKHSKEQILELLILEQLLNILPREIQSHVRASGPESCSQAVGLAEEFLLRLEKEVPLEESAGSTLKMGQVLSESEQRHPSMDIKEEEDGEASLLGDDQQNEVDEELYRLSSVKAKNPELAGHFKNPDRAKGQEGSHMVKKRDQPHPCQGRDFCEVTNMGEETCKYSECRMDASDEAQYNNNNSEIKTFKCLECGKSFSCTSKLLRHQRIHAVGKLYICSPCGKSFSHKPNFILHQRIHTEQKPFICSESEKSFSDGNKNNVHFSKHTNMKASKCFQCGKYFRYKSQFLTHLRIHTGEKPFECSECGKNFIRSFHLQRHLRTHTGEKPFECPECKKKFNQSYNFQQHLRTHTGEKPFECLECGKKFNKSSNFQQHQRIHTGEKPFECSECGKKFNQSYHLQRHLRTHIGARPFQCSDCGNNSNWIASVHQPQRTHREGKTFECSKCGKCFSRSADLQWHQGIYTRKKPYECSDCGKKFSQSYHLQRHLKTHTAEKPFQCSECEKEFIQSCHLEQHQRTHTGEKPFE